MTLRQAPAEIIEASTSPLVGIADWWERCELGHVAEVANGAAFKSALFNNEGEGLPLIRIRDVGRAETSVHYSGDYEPRHIVEPGDLLIGMDGDFRVARWTGDQALLNQRVCRLRVLDASRYSDRFLEVVLQPYLDEIHKVTSSVTVKHLSSRTVQQLPIPLPPRAEQDRIVAVLEEHFSRIDAAEAALLAAQQKADALLRAVVGEVCRGSWEIVPLAEVITSLRNGVFVSRPAAKPPGHPIYRISAVRPLRLRIDDVRYAPPEPKGADEYVVNSGDVLFTRYSGNASYVGAAAVVPDAGSGVLHPDKLIRVVVDRARVLPDWLAAYVSVGEGRRQVEMRLKTTAGQVGIAGGQLKTVPIAIPPIDYQRSAATRIAAIMSDQDRIEQHLRTLRVKMSTLKCSILSDALKGHPVPRAGPSDQAIDAD